MKTIGIFSLLSLLCFRQCGSRVAVEPMQAASVIFTGHYQVDGCGYQILTEKTSQLHKPVNLPEKYCVDGLKIWVEFKEGTTRYECGDLPKGRTTIELLKIMERHE